MNTDGVITISYADLMTMAQMALSILLITVWLSRELVWRQRLRVQLDAARANVTDTTGAPAQEASAVDVPVVHDRDLDVSERPVRRLRDVPSVAKIFVDFARENGHVGEILHCDLYAFYEAEFVPLNPDLRVIAYNQFTVQLEAVGCQRGQHRHPGANPKVTIVIPATGAIQADTVAMPAATVALRSDADAARGAGKPSRGACEARRDATPARCEAPRVRAVAA